MRYDEVFGPDEIDHAFRVTVRATNGYVYPASHRAGATPRGAADGRAPAAEGRRRHLGGFTPEVQKIFRAMKRYGLIVADNGSDMYISGTYDTRWDNDVLNPAFARLTANDFEVVAARTGTPLPPALVAAATPATGTTAGGTAVQVTGSFFKTGAAVSFGGTPATSVAVERSTRLVATTPAHAAGPVGDPGHEPRRAGGDPRRRLHVLRGGAPGAGDHRAVVDCGQCLGRRGERRAERGQRLHLVPLRRHDHRRAGDERHHVRRRASGDDDDPARDRHLCRTALRPRASARRRWTSSTSPPATCSAIS